MTINRTVVLTGAAGGLGRIMAAQLVGTGHRVALIDSNEEALNDLQTQLRAQTADAKIEAVALDLRRTDLFPACLLRCEKTLGPVDALINNAGVYVSAIRSDFREKPIRFWELDPTHFRHFFEVNAIAPMELARLVAPGMIARRFGRIVNVTTSLSTMLRTGCSPYGGTKASLEAHSLIMSKDLDGTGVTVNVLVPGGAADTPMIPPAHTADRHKLIPPAVMGPPLLWLLSDAAAHVSGKRIMAAVWNKNAPDDLPSAAWPDLP